MMKIFILSFLCLSPLLAGATLNGFIKAYENKDNDEACLLGRGLFRDDVRDESVLIAIGHACAQNDYIDFIGVLQQRLGKTPSSRRASIYFSTLILKKRLISEFMHEGNTLSFYTLPHTNHILSKVFEAIKNKDYKLVSEHPKHLHIGNSKDYIEVYEDEKIFVNVYENGKKIQSHRYR